MIRDLKGREYYSIVIFNEEEGGPIAVSLDSSLPTGAYFVAVSFGNQLYRRKLLVK